jgi:glycosyltransferase involved in cell wall biosynthesis
MTTYALVLETNNLTGGGADTLRTAQSLERLLARLREQTRPLAQLDEFVITHDGLPSGARARLDAIAGKDIRWVEIDAETDYYEAKNRGFDATTADVVAFADADCWPEPAWLEALFAPFADRTVDVTAGRTTYRTDILGTAASTIDFMYFDSPLGAGCTRNFYANNVAFRRFAFGSRRYATHDMYRGHCQVLGTRLHADGVKVHFVPDARTIHRFPDSVAELVKLRLLRGEDVISLAPHLVKTYMPMAVPLVKLGPVVPLAVLAARFGFSVASINKQDMPPAHGARWLGVVGAIAGISLVDAVGTVARTLGWRPGSRGASSAKVTLSYHRDGDQLDAAHTVAA